MYYLRKWCGVFFIAIYFAIYNFVYFTDFCFIIFQYVAKTDFKLITDYFSFFKVICPDYFISEI